MEAEKKVREEEERKRKEQEEKEKKQKEEQARKEREEKRKAGPDAPTLAKWQECMEKASEGETKVKLLKEKIMDREDQIDDARKKIKDLKAQDGQLFLGRL